MSGLVVAILLLLGFSYLLNNTCVFKNHYWSRGVCQKCGLKRIRIRK